LGAADTRVQGAIETVVNIVAAPVLKHSKKNNYTIKKNFPSRKNKLRKQFPVKTVSDGYLRQPELKRSFVLELLGLLDKFGTSDIQGRSVKDRRDSWDMTGNRDKLDTIAWKQRD
jgi:hypothetical protein